MSTRPVARRTVLIGAAALAAATYPPRAALGGTKAMIRGYIHLNDIVVEASPDGVPTTVTGPSVRWGNPLNGLTGTIPVGTYG
ncbi:hypothetical protein AB0H43_32470 [Hamadaea sp. NPDC050747]|uniref:hypothetical protein n=1 Tax=Hamadaea sp. NPDC050747 TaxID=3155789 RepID=UPI0033F66A5C